jgi:hypothetical protein
MELAIHYGRRRLLPKAGWKPTLSFPADFVPIILFPGRSIRPWEKRIARVRESIKESGHRRIEWSQLKRWTS